VRRDFGRQWPVGPCVYGVRRLFRRGGGRDVVEAGWLGQLERGQDLAVAVGELGARTRSGGRRLIGGRWVSQGPDKAIDGADVDHLNGYQVRSRTLMTNKQYS